MINVALVVGVYTGGGIGVVVGSLVKEMRKLGINYTVVTKKALAASSEVEIAEVGPYSSKAVNELKKYDVVHVMGGSTLAMPALLSKRKSVFTFQGQTPPELRGSYRKYAMAFAIEMLYKSTMRKFDVVTCASKFGQIDIKKRYGVRKSFWIPNGVDRKLFMQADTSAIRKIGKKYSHPLFLGVGNLYPEKGWSQTLEYFEEYLKEQPDASLLIAGEGILKSALLARIKNSDFNGRVHLLGPVPIEDLYKYYNSADAYVSGSLYEGFCLPAIEALACGKPILVRHTGAMVEHALGSGCGRTFLDAKSFSKAAQKVLELDDAGIKRSAEKYLKPYTWKNAAESYVKIYKKLVRDHGD